MALPTITALPTPPARTDAPATFNIRADALLNAFPGLVAQINAFSAALPAMVNGIDYNGTSATSNSIGTGSKSFVTQAGKNFQLGQFVTVAATAAPANFMSGQVTSYNAATGDLIVSATSTGGVGTFSAWTISLAPSSTAYLPLAGGALTGDLSLSGTLAFSSLSNFYITVQSGSPIIAFDANDYLSYDRTNNVLNLVISSTIALAISGAYAVFGGAIQLQAASGGTAGAIGYSSGNLVFGDGTAERTVVTTNTAQTLTNKTLTSPTINAGNINGVTLDAATLVSDTNAIAVNSVGFRGLPQNAKTSAYALALTDNGKHVDITTGGVTIPANASVAFPIGARVWVFNDSSSTQTIAITSDTLRHAGTTTTGTYTMKAYELVELVKVGATTWIARGAVSPSAQGLVKAAGFLNPSAGTITNAFNVSSVTWSGSAITVAYTSSITNSVPVITAGDTSNSSSSHSAFWGNASSISSTGFSANFGVAGGGGTPNRATFITVST